MDDSTDLIVLQDALPTVFDSVFNLQTMLAALQKRARSETHDVRTEEGRTGIASLARKVSRSKTAIQSIGDPLAKEAREKWDNLNVFRRELVDRLDALRDEIRAPLTKWRDIEAARVKAHEDALHVFEAQMLSIPGLGPDMIRTDIETIRQVSVGGEWEEFQDAAVEAKAKAMAHLESILAEAEKAAAAAAELEELRREKDERERADRKAEAKAEVQRMIDTAAERARAAEKTKAAAALEAERDKSEREHREAEQRVAAAERERDEAAAAERKRAEVFEAEKNAAREKRERDDENRAHVFSMATDALVAAPVKLKRADAVRVVAAISDKLIPYLRINF